MREFLFVADNLALDFVNTEMMSGGERIDVLQTSDDLRDWLAKAPRGDTPDTTLLSLNAKQWPALLREALELRRAIRSLATAIVEKQRTPRASLDVINRLL